MTVDYHPVMQLRTYVYTENAPRPVGPYSQAVCVNGWLFVSGQIPLDPVTGSMVEGDFRLKVKRVLDNVKAIVEIAGGSLGDVVKVTVFLRDLGKLQEFNEVYSGYFGANPPARSVVGASGLPRNADLEVEALAYIGECRDTRPRSTHSANPP